MSEGQDWRAAYFTLIEDCEKRERYLSSWEHDFLASIRGQLDDMRALSAKQIEILDRIWNKVTARG